MGTNYYFQRDYLTVKPIPPPLHIGKSSFGWYFSLHVIPELGINDLTDWQRLWEENKEGFIYDEYNALISVEEMLDEITKRDKFAPKSKKERSIEFLNRNYAEEAEHGLLRHKIGRGCKKHGEGTYDLVEGEFS